MGKSNPKTSKSGKGVSKRNSDEECERKSRSKDKSKIVDNGVPDNEHQQNTPKKSVGKRSAKKLNFDEYQLRQKKKKAEREIEETQEPVRQPEVEIRGNQTSAKFIEDGDEVLFEIEGQSTEFASENEMDEDLEHENQGDHVEIPNRREEQALHCEGGDDVISINNNATVASARGVNQSRLMEINRWDILEASTSSGAGKSMQVSNDEEQGMQRFGDYIRKQGLVIVDSSKLRNQSPKFRKGYHSNPGMLTDKGTQSEFNDNESMVTVYHNAVEQVPMVDQTMNNAKRVSSSSEEQLDTSDELERLQVNNITLQGVNAGSNPPMDNNLFNSIVAPMNRNEPE